MSKVLAKEDRVGRRFQRPQKGTSSKYKGVYWYKRSEKWKCEINIGGKNKHLGYFQSEIEAAETYDKAATMYFGSDAYLNFPSEGDLALKNNQSEVIGARAIELTKGEFALVDEEDYDFLMGWNWIYSDGYAATHAIKPCGKKRMLTMHRLLMNPREGMVVDHINHVKSDNRKGNLRICTHQQNLMGQKPQKGSSSKYKGVHWHKINKKWKAQITLEGKSKYIGSFPTEIEAAQAYDTAARIHYGEYAYLNFPRELEQGLPYEETKSGLLIPKQMKLAI